MIATFLTGVIIAGFFIAVALFIYAVIEIFK